MNKIILIFITLLAFATNLNGFFVISDENDNCLFFPETGESFGSPDGDTNALFNKPSGLSFFDATLYIADKGNSRIVSIDDPTGKNLQEFGEFGSGFGQFDKPNDVKIDAKGRIYIADSGNDRIVRIDDMTGKNWIEYGSYGSGKHRFFCPEAMCFDREERLYVADKYNLRFIRIDNMKGKNWIEQGVFAELDLPQAIYVDENFQIFIADYFRERILLFKDMQNPEFETFRWPLRDGKGFRNVKSIIGGKHSRLIAVDNGSGNIFSFVPEKKPHWQIEFNKFKKPVGLTYTDWTQ